MKVDVVVAYHEATQANLAWHVRWGLEQNAEHISRVIYVNDGGPPTTRVPPHGIPTEWLGQQGKGFGLCRSLNLGLKHATSEFVLIIEGDEVLAPGSLAQTLSFEPQTNQLLCCPKRYIAEETDLDNPEFIEEDHRTNASFSRRWMYCSGGHLLVDASAHAAIGGFNEAFGYGLHDYDYAARWMMAHGSGSIVWRASHGPVWHIGSGKGRALPEPAAYKLFARTLADLYSHRYHFACGLKFDPSCLNVDNRYETSKDVVLDVLDPSWIEDGSAQLIHFSHFLEHIPLQEVKHFLRECHRKLAPNGAIQIEGPDMAKCCEAYLAGKHQEALQGFYGHPERNARDGERHYWGWDVASTCELLESCGFEIETQGDSPSQMVGWRDFRVEAIKPAHDEEPDPTLLEKAELGT